jgi:hypothetical protein
MCLMFRESRLKEWLLWLWAWLESRSCRYSGTCDSSRTHTWCLHTVSRGTPFSVVFLFGLDLSWQKLVSLRIRAVSSVMFIAIQANWALNSLVRSHRVFLLVRSNVWCPNGWMMKLTCSYYKRFTIIVEEFVIKMCSLALIISSRRLYLLVLQIPSENISVK